MLLASLLLMSAAVAEADVPPVPGLCTGPVPEDRDTPGCYKTGEVALDGTKRAIYWHIYAFSDAAAAAAEARKHRHAATTQMHAIAWLYVLGSRDETVTGGSRKAMIGPIPVGREDMVAHFAASVFPPGMRTRVHSHPGAEAFYVVDGEQCMETPSERRLVRASETYVVTDGLHLQAAPKGRRNLVLILAPRGKPAVIPGGDWKPTGFCER